MLGASVELRLMPSVGGSNAAAWRFVRGRWRDWELSSPFKALRIGAPADKFGFDSSGIRMFERV